MVGFHGRASGTIIEVPDCQLLDPKIMTGFPIAEELATIGTSRKAALAVALTVSEDGLDASVTGGKELNGPLRSELAQLCDRSGLARLTWDGETIAMRTPPRHAFGKAKVVVPAGGFLQATAHGAATLQALVGEIVKGSKRVADLFAGSGTFTLPLAQISAVHAVEGDKAMVAALDQGWRMALDLKPVTSEARDLFRRPMLPDELAKFDAVVLDPPRAGAVEQVRELANSKVNVIAYVSCNPVTFAATPRSWLRPVLFWNGFNLLISSVGLRTLNWLAHSAAKIPKLRGRNSLLDDCIFCPKSDQSC